MIDRIFVACYGISAIFQPRKARKIGGGGGDLGFHTCVTCKYSYGMRAVLGRRG